MGEVITCLGALTILIIYLAVSIDFGYRYTFSEKNILGDQSPQDIANETNWLKDWNDYAAIEAALNTTGLGEVGRPANITDYRMELYREYGYDALLSDHISLNRSVPDTRPDGCKNATQLAQLPKVAVIIIFFNERRSVLLRNVYGIINRTPPELLQEIILVDDFSTYAELHSPLTEYLRLYLPTYRSKVRLIRIPKRSGLMVARMTGARAASNKSEVFIFLDAHFEVNYNWLPPLLEPIALNPKACTCPVLDTVSYDEFQYKHFPTFRGYFDWTLGYKFKSLKPHEYETPAKNFREYVLMGASIAIGSKFFWDLGGFDEGMVLWGGEQYELSFKIWMCGGEIITVPCSRMAHLFRDAGTKGNTNLYGNYEFLSRNFRRLIDVWMDEEHRQYIFNRLPGVKEADPGNLTDRFAIRDRLQCKSFSWMMENIMPDLKDKYLPVEPFHLGSGLLRSQLDPSLCVSLTEDKKVVLDTCSNEKTTHWVYNYRGEIQFYGACLETDIWNFKVNSYSCHELDGNQKWYFDRKNQWFIQEEHNLCITASIEDRLVKLSTCEENNLSLKWTMSHTNETEMDTWEYKLRRQTAHL